MNRTAIANYAPSARRDFINAVSERAAAFALSETLCDHVDITGDFVVINGISLTAAQAEARNALAEQIRRHGFLQVMEEAAYTWFNRFVALRYMELHGWLSCGCRILGSESATGLPGILEHLTDLDSDMLPHADLSRARELRLDGGKEEELYRLLLIAQCNGLADAMPLLFEKVSDASELLLPSHLLSSDGLIRKLVDAIPEEDWEEVEIIGWIYQYYISEKKDQVIGKVVKSEDIPAATQLFTPNWIVQYMVQNTLGRQWAATYPSSDIKASMPYYIEPAEQSPEVNAQLEESTPKSLDPESITFLDPACGSGHILVEAYNIFKLIYEERGYSRRDIPRLILEKNLFGLDIDPRAAQLSQFALLMRARKDDRRILERTPAMNIMALKKSDYWGDLYANGNTRINTLLRVLRHGTPQAVTDNRPVQGSLVQTAPVQGFIPTADAISKEELVLLLNAFTDADTFGSLIRISKKVKSALPRIRKAAEKALEADTESQAEAERLMPFIRQAELLAGTYDCVVANPPYMGGKGLNPKLKEFAQKEYPDGKGDLFAMFLDRGLSFIDRYSRMTMVTMQSWMFLSSFESLRTKLLAEASIENMLHMGNGVMGIAFGTAATVFQKGISSALKGKFCYAENDDIQDSKPRVFPPHNERNSKAAENGWFYTAAAGDFAKIPGSPVAYWVSEKVRRIFEKYRRLDTLSKPKQGATTSDNNRFLRLWFEVSNKEIGFLYKSINEAKISNKKWFPYNKGGQYRKWYGNQDFIINYKNDGEEIKYFHNIINKNSPGGRLKNQDYYFKSCLSWSKISSSLFSIRYFPYGFIFDVAGSAIFFENINTTNLVNGLLNSCIIKYIIPILSPTLNYEAEQLCKLPIINIENLDNNYISLINKLVNISNVDWNSYEISWDFHVLPILLPENLRATLSETYASVRKSWQNMTDEMQGLEVENNCILIKAYDLQDEISSDVPLKEITLTCNPWYRYGEDEEAYRSQGEDALAAKTKELEDRLRADTVKELIQYAIGCMMGRYSLDAPGLAYAAAGGEGFDATKYTTFPADDDGILPILDHYWFEDDVAHRFTEFCKAIWGEETLEENLRFAAEQLNPKANELPEDTIRRWLSTKYFKEWHLKTYKKRPIYWLFSSGKQKAFECLVYLHRFNRNTLARMRSMYVIPMYEILERNIKLLDAEMESAPSTAKRRELAKEKTSLEKKQVELKDFDSRLRHIEEQNITIDLDDGVRVNYGKFGNLLAEAKAITGGKDD
ncbi:MAG: BREX-1 system adenine-specific DNA-methyltransferase PglX [Desulfovibrionaceae bacterium]|nr:BREX-1 system adenine-specific DNA-methyltransferase PglX [Desulfovibrionaceae bacterium]